MGLLETLIVGSYLFTLGVWKYLSSKLDRLVNNHIKHILERLDILEGK